MRGIDKSIVTRWWINRIDGEAHAISIHRWQLRTGNVRRAYALTPSSLKRATRVDVARVTGAR